MLYHRHYLFEANFKGSVWVKIFRRIQPTLTLTPACKLLSPSVRIAQRPRDCHSIEIKGVSQPFQNTNRLLLVCHDSYFGFSQFTLFTRASCLPILAMLHSSSAYSITIRNCSSRTSRRSSSQRVSSFVAKGACLAPGASSASRSLFRLSLSANSRNVISVLVHASECILFHSSFSVSPPLVRQHRYFP